MRVATTTYRPICLLSFLNFKKTSNELVKCTKNSDQLINKVLKRGLVRLFVDAYPNMCTVFN